MPEQIINCVLACTVTVRHELVFPVLNLTLEEGAQIAVAIAAVWAVGFGFRALIQTLKNVDGSSTDERE